MENESFGQLVERLRKEKKMTIYELAEKSGLSTVEVSNIENDKHKPRLTTLNKLVGALQCDYMLLYNAYQRIK